MLDSLRPHMKGSSSNEKKAASAERPQQHSPSPPPAYWSRSTDIDVPFSQLDLNTRGDKPTTDQCIAHLKLLAAIHELQESIAHHDGFMGLQDDLANGDDKITCKIQEKRWAVYAAKAVKRFEVWWKQCAPSDSGMLKEHALDDLQDNGFEKYQPKFTWARDALPPLGKRNPLSSE